MKKTKFDYLAYGELAAVALALTVISDGSLFLFILPYFALRMFMGFWPWGRWL